MRTPCPTETVPTYLNCAVSGVAVAELRPSADIIFVLLSTRKSVIVAVPLLW